MVMCFHIHLIHVITNIGCTFSYTYWFHVQIPCSHRRFHTLQFNVIIHTLIPCSYTHTISMCLPTLVPYYHTHWFHVITPTGSSYLILIYTFHILNQKKAQHVWLGGSMEYENDGKITYSRKTLTLKGGTKSVKYGIERRNCDETMRSAFS